MFFGFGMVMFLIVKFPNNIICLVQVNGRSMLGRKSGSLVPFQIRQQEILFFWLFSPSTCPYLEHLVHLVNFLLSIPKKNYIIILFNISSANLVKSILNSNRFFEGPDDVFYTCLLPKILKNMPETQRQLISKGRKDNSTIATISVTIKYTKGPFIHYVSTFLGFLDPSPSMAAFSCFLKNYNSS